MRGKWVCSAAVRHFSIVVARSDYDGWHTGDLLILLYTNTAVDVINFGSALKLYVNESDAGYVSGIRTVLSHRPYGGPNINYIEKRYTDMDCFYQNTCEKL